MNLVRIFTSYQTEEIYFVKSLLDQANITAFIYDENIGHTGLSLAIGGIKLFVYDHDQALAKDIIDDYLTTKASTPVTAPSQEPVSQPTIPENSRKVILITGCSSGFGLLTAVRLAVKGHYVYATMRDLSKKELLLGEVIRRRAHLSVKELDVTKPETIKTAIKEILQERGTIDVVINNAGYGIGGFFEDLTDDEIRRQMDVNFFGVQNVIREVLPILRPRRKGLIINISSVAGLSASPCFGAYNASKWALEGFSESLYHELKLFGINVALVEPGTYKTKIFYENARYARNFDNPQSPYYTWNQDLRNLVMDFVDRSTKDPEDVARLVERLIETKNPSFRNIPDMPSRFLYLLRRIMPFRLYAWIFKRALLKMTAKP